MCWLLFLLIWYVFVWEYFSEKEKVWLGCFCFVETHSYQEFFLLCLRITFSWNVHKKLFYLTFVVFLKCLLKCFSFENKGKIASESKCICKAGVCIIPHKRDKLTKVLIYMPSRSRSYLWSSSWPWYTNVVWSVR